MRPTYLLFPGILAGTIFRQRASPGPFMPDSFRDVLWPKRGSGWQSCIRGLSTNNVLWIQSLLRNHPASNAIAGVARRIGLHIIGFGVDHERSATIAEQRMAVAAECDVSIVDGCLRGAIAADSEVLHVAGMVAVGTFEAMLLVIGIEMRARGLKVWPIALRVLVDMDCVFARRQVLCIELDIYALLSSG